jgi:hypothetical protein
MLIPASHTFAAISCVTICKPYFKVFGNDVFAGGWFVDSNGFCSTAKPYYQDDNTVLPNQNYGGIMAFTRFDTGTSKLIGGSSSQYGAFSLGKVDGSAVNYGIYSNGANSGGVNSPSSLTFDNTDNSPWGGKFQGTIQQSHCISDYRSKKPSDTRPLVPAGQPGDSLASLASAGTSGSFYARTFTPGDVLDLNSTATVNISTTTKITVFIDGPVYIGQNITYSGTPNTNQVPKFALIVRGSIYIDPNVTALDGLYIAQPDPGNPDQVNNDTGVIWTCHGNTTTINLAYIAGSCGNNKLTVANGAFIAKQINLTRIKGDVANAGLAEDQWSTANSSGNISELFNYSPLMVIGGGFFTPTERPPFNIESLVSMPPTL